VRKTPSLRSSRLRLDPRTTASETCAARHVVPTIMAKDSFHLRGLKRKGIPYNYIALNVSGWRSRHRTRFFSCPGPSPLVSSTRLIVLSPPVHPSMVYVAKGAPFRALCRRDDPMHTA
jgi:hypothetical protein